MRNRDLRPSMIIYTFLPFAYLLNNEHSVLTVDLIVAIGGKEIF